MAAGLIVITLMQRIAMLLIMAVVGVLLVKGKLLAKEDGRVMATIIVYAFTPCVVLRSFLIEYDEQIRDGFLFATAVAIIVHIVLILVCNLTSLAFPLRRVEKASLIYSNAGSMALIIIPTVLGEEWMIYASAFICVQIVFTWTHELSLMQNSKGIDWNKIIKNPNLIAVVVGIIMFFFSIRLPRPASDAIETMAQAIPATGMIVIGMRLAYADWKKLLREKRIFLMVLMKMIVLPGIILLLMKFSGAGNVVANGGTILLVSFISVITPSGNTVAQLAQLYDTEPDYASAINVMTTLVCMFTMPFMVWLFLL